MRIDSHTHVFNLLTVATPYALRVFLARKDAGFPVWLSELLERTIRKLAEKSRRIEREEIVRSIVAEMLSDKRAAELIEDLPIAELVPGAGRLTKSLLGRLGNDALDRILAWIERKLRAEDPDCDVYESKLSDYISYVCIAFKPRIADVCSDMFAGMAATDGVIALMMDITDNADNEDVFVDQMEQMAQMILRYPGRFFPFVAVNPLRKTKDDPRFEKLLRRAVGQLGFVGVKLYPSLGYPLDSPDMRRVYDYCLEKELPITLHCNGGGFTPANAEYWKHADPSELETLLRSDPRYRALRICFGHFGGDDVLADGYPFADKCWTAAIVNLMKAPESHVYADVSYHTAAMCGGKDSDRERNYFRNLSDLLSDEVVRDRLLFGTDHWMVRVRCAPKSYWNYFRTRLRKYMGDAAGADAWDAMTRTNPSRFLGLPLHGRIAATTPIRAYARYIGDHAAKVGQLPAPWLKELAEAELFRSVTFEEGVSLNRLCMDSPVDRVIYEFFRDSSRFGMSKKLDPRQTGDLPLRELRYFKITGNQRSLAIKTVTVILFKKICTATKCSASVAVTVSIQKMLSNGDMRIAELARNITLSIRMEAPE
ncbi:MAG: amidohydrolase family protein [Kiritimatiellia bacterium]|nr:amidohydrolase family protein [Kiritimatiellia bacterium]